MLRVGVRFSYKTNSSSRDCIPLIPTSSGFNADVIHCASVCALESKITSGNAGQFRNVIFSHNKSIFVAAFVLGWLRRVYSS